MVFTLSPLANVSELFGRISSSRDQPGYKGQKEPVMPLPCCDPSSGHAGWLLQHLGARKDKEALKSVPNSSLLPHPC